MKALYFNTFHKEYRNKAIIFLFVITILVILVANSLLNYLREEVVTNLGIQDIGQQGLMVFYYVISSWSTLVAIYIGVGTIKSDMESGALVQLMSFPISRTQYFLTRIFGAFSIVFLYYLLSVSLAMILFSLSTKNIIFNWSIFGALFFSGLDIFFVILLSAFFAIYWGTLKTLFALIFLLMYMSASSFHWGGKEWQLIYKDFSIIDTFKFIIYWILPRLKSVNDMASSILVSGELPKNWWSDLLHYFGTATFWCVGFIKVFNKKDL